MVVYCECCALSLRQTVHSSRGVQYSVCVCVTFSVIRCNNNHLHLYWVRRTGQTTKERKERKVKNMICFMKFTKFKKKEIGKAGNLYTGPTNHKRCQWCNLLGINTFQIPSVQFHFRLIRGVMFIWRNRFLTYVNTYISKTINYVW
jgi:hypothetical protein